MHHRRPAITFCRPRRPPVEPIDDRRYCRPDEKCPLPAYPLPDHPGLSTLPGLVRSCAPPKQVTFIRNPVSSHHLLLERSIHQEIHRRRSLVARDKTFTEV